VSNLIEKFDTLFINAQTEKAKILKMLVCLDYLIKIYFKMRLC